MVRFSRSPPANPGMTLETLVVKARRPSSTAWNTSTLVKALVTENRLNTESFASGVRWSR